MVEMIERVASAIEATMFAPHELPLDTELHEKYLMTARAAMEAMPAQEVLEYIEMADNRLECEGCPQCLSLARSYLVEAIALLKSNAVPSHHQVSEEK